MAPLVSLPLSLHNMSHHLNSPMHMAERVNGDEEESAAESSTSHNHIRGPYDRVDQRKYVEEKNTSASSSSSSSTSFSSSSSLSSTSSSSTSSSSSSSSAVSMGGLDPNACEFTPTNPNPNPSSSVSSLPLSSSSALASSSSINMNTHQSLVNMSPHIFNYHPSHYQYNPNNPLAMESIYNNGSINVNPIHSTYINDQDQQAINLELYNKTTMHPSHNVAFNSTLINPQQIMQPLVYSPNATNPMHVNPSPNPPPNPRGISPPIYIHNQFLPHNGSSSSKEHISRALLLTGVPPGISEAAIHDEVEKSWGEIRSLQCERASEGLVLVQFYDLRCAKQALKDMQSKHLLRQQRFRQNQEEISSYRVQSNQYVNSTSISVKADPNANTSSSANSTTNMHANTSTNRNATTNAMGTDEAGPCANKEGSKGLICGHVVWAQYIAAWNMYVEDAHNQGTLVLFNVGSDISMRELREVFERFGNVRELREAPMKKQHKFVEFYDIRDAAAAWSSLNGKEVCGKTIKIEFSKQGRLSNANINVGVGRKHTKEPPSHPMLHPNTMLTPQDHHINQEQCSWSHGDLPFHGYYNMGYPPNYNMAMFPGHLEWPRLPLDSNVQSPPSAAATVSTSVASCSLNVFDHEPMMMVEEETPPFVTYAYAHDIKGKRLSNANTGFGGEVVAGPRRMRRSGPHLSNDPKCRSKSSSNTNNSNRIGHENGNCSGEKQMYEALRHHQHHHHGHHHHRGGGHLHFEFDEREVYVMSGNPRTTLMIRNIPNKYSQQMLLSLLDKHCLDCNRRIQDIDEPESAYDFVYLPIDFKNRCNLGYAFVNFTTALATLKFYKSFDEQAWEAFNSRKICKIAYARVQGRPALEDHFRNSRFACDTDEYLPLVFVPPRNGIEFPTPRVAAGQSGPSAKGGRADGRPGLSDGCKSSSSSIEGQKEEENVDGKGPDETFESVQLDVGNDKGMSDCCKEHNDVIGESGVVDLLDCCKEHDELIGENGDLEGGVDVGNAMSKLQVEA